MPSPPHAHPGVARASRLDLPGSISDINDYFDQQGWTDGLPIIPPTEDLVQAMLDASPVPAEQVLGRLPPRNGTVTVEKVAINAVMAGCRSAYFPVVLAAVKAVLQPQFNAGAITTTTGGAAAENAARNPWEPLHVELGFAPDTSIVVVVAARGIITMVEASQESGLGDLETLVSSMRGEGISGYAYQARGASPVVVLGPEHAAEIAAAGFSRKAVKEYIVQHARMPLGQLRDRGHWGARSWPEDWEHQPEDFLVPLVTSPDTLILVVAGGDGRHSSWFPAWSATQRAVEVIAEPPSSEDVWGRTRSSGTTQQARRPGEAPG
jgi:hypothetical protein